MTPKSTLNLLNLDNVLRAKEKEEKKIKSRWTNKNGEKERANINQHLSVWRQSFKIYINTPNHKNQIKTQKNH